MVMVGLIMGFLFVFSAAFIVGQLSSSNLAKPMPLPMFVLIAICIGNGLSFVEYYTKGAAELYWPALLLGFQLSFIVAAAGILSFAGYRKLRKKITVTIR